MNFEDRITEVGYTYDDLSLIPAYSRVLPLDVDVTARLTNKLGLKIPIIAAAMDTLSEIETSIALPRYGGISIIHKNCTIARQAEMVMSVKRTQSGLINKPFTLGVNATAGDARNLMATKKISGIPILGKGKKVVGIVTRRDLRLAESDASPVTRIMTRFSKLHTGTIETTIEQAQRIMEAKKIEKLPLIDAHRQLVGLYTYRDILNIKNYPLAVTDAKGRLLVGAAIGASGDYLERLDALVDAGVDIINIDSSHGDSENVENAVKEVKKRYPDMPIIAGNVATYEGALTLIKAGADAVKVGIGPGAICTTRVITGGGVPQITAIANAARACHEQNIPLIADGGIKYSGDITKALAAGADCVMLGSLLAGTDEAPGDTVTVGGRKFKVYRGMGSLAALKEGSRDRYFQENVDPHDSNKLVPQGVEGRVPYRGPLANVLHQLVGGLRFGMGLCGVATIRELWNAKFCKVTSAGLQEGHPHSIEIDKEAPNYQGRR